MVSRAYHIHLRSNELAFGLVDELEAQFAVAPTVSVFHRTALTIWYTVTETPDRQVVIVVQYVKADT
jgi:hypothetical protein